MVGSVPQWTGPATVVGPPVAAGDGAADWLVISLGANLGDPLRQLCGAAAQLQQRFPGSRLSCWWQSPPVNCPPGSAAFVNGVLLAPRPADPADVVLRYLHGVERMFGRRRDVRNGPRTLDLDLILYGDQQCSTATLSLPHPRALQRAFVLAPLAELAPELVWPQDGRRVRECLAALPELPGLRRWSGSAPHPPVIT